MRQVDERCKLLERVSSGIEDPRSASRTDHLLLQLLRQRVYQVAAGYEDCNERLAGGRAVEFSLEPHPTPWGGNKLQTPPGGAGQSALCRFENKILATGEGLKALEESLSRSADTLLRRRNKRHLIVDIDSTEDPVHGNQEGAAFNGYFEQVCYHLLFCFTGKWDLLGAKLGPGNAHSDDGVLDIISPLVNRYRSWFEKFWLRGDAAFARPALYEFCERVASLTSFGFPATVA